MKLINSVYTWQKFALRLKICVPSIIMDSIAHMKDYGWLIVGFWSLKVLNNEILMVPWIKAILLYYPNDSPWTNLPPFKLHGPFYSWQQTTKISVTDLHISSEPVQCCGTWSSETVTWPFKMGCCFSPSPQPGLLLPSHLLRSGMDCGQSPDEAPFTHLGPTPFSPLANLFCTHCQMNTWKHTSDGAPGQKPSMTPLCLNDKAQTLNLGHYGLNCISSCIDILESLSPVHQNVTLFGDRVLQKQSS